MASDWSRLLAAASFAILGDPCIAATPHGRPYCKTLETNCLAFVARQRSVVGVRASDAPDPTVDEYCHDSYAEARQTSIWPAHGGRPEIGCRNN